MIIEREPDGGVRLGDMSAFLAELVKLLPAIAESGGDGSARQRIFPSPGLEGDEAEEWRELVEPGMRELFESADETVRRDLEGLTVGEDPSDNTLWIAREHQEAWLNCLNRARLVLAEKNGLGEERMAESFNGMIRNPGDLALFQVHFYGILMEKLLEGWTG